MMDPTFLRAACASTQDWRRLQELLAGIGADELPRFLDVFYQQVDQSDFSLGDWICALLTFDRWLAKRDITHRPLESMADYIHCCTLTLSCTLPPPDLARLTNKMLDQHGFDAADC